MTAADLLPWWVQLLIAAIGVRLLAGPVLRRWWLRKPFGGWYGPYWTKRQALKDVDAHMGIGPVRRIRSGGYVHGSSTEIVRGDLLEEEPDAVARRLS